MTHDPEALKQFADPGDRRLVFARSDREGVVVMPDGDAELFRTRAKAGEQFRCVVDNCDSPALSVVNRGARRHGFSHRAGATGHARMGVAHILSQILIRDWLRDRYPDAAVDLEVTTEDGRRRADVMLTSASGRQAAFEVQYASLTPAAWQARHDDYAAADVTDVWLWGHLVPHFRAHRREPGHVALNPTLEAVAAAGQPILWINPDHALIGFATSPTARWDTGSNRVLASDESGLFESQPLDAFRLTVEHGMISDRLRFLLDTPARIAREQEQQGLAAEAALLLSRQRAAADEKRKREALERYLQRADKAAAERATAWATSEERAHIVKLAGGTWPPFLGLVTRGGDGTLVRLEVPPELWQARLWRKHLYAKPDRTEIQLWKLNRDLAEMGVSDRVAAVAVNSWLKQLAGQGVVERTGRGHGEVRFVICNVEERRRHVEREQAAQKADLAQEAAHNRWFEGVVRLIPLPEGAVPIRLLLNLTRSSARACPACTGAMNDSDSQRFGYHSRCAPVIEAKFHVTVAIRDR